MKLVIVESPTKARTINQFIGKNFEVVSSNGHVRDLPRGKMGIDVKKDFHLQYVIPTKKRKLVNELKKMAKNKKEIILATDEDREGEAIAWHLKQILEDKNEKKVFSRITFHEITPLAIKNALKTPREINLNLVNAQQARRALDRLVGYELSPLLWKKVASHLSAGRVQSPALRLIVEREEEREKFQKKEYWLLSVLLKTNPPLKAELKKINNLSIEKTNLSEKEIKAIIEDIGDNQFKVKKIEKKSKQLKPPPPFHTASLQIEAYRKLKFKARRTMAIAQRLYEGLPLENNKPSGLITYMRTDSHHLSREFVKQAEVYIKKKFGQEYWQPKTYKTKSFSAQEAHEAIRPTNLKYQPEKIKPYLKKEELALYTLIWKRSLACLMAKTKLDITKINLQVKGRKEYIFGAQGQTINFSGYLALYQEKQKEYLLPHLDEGQNIKKDKLIPSQHFTQPPARYNDASLIKKLAALEIGRPSTYVPIIRTLEARTYVQRENNYLKPKEIGKKVNHILTKYFPNIVDYSFTAKMERDLDKIAQGKKDYQKVLADFYFPFKKTLEEKREKVPNFKEKPIPLKETCPECGAQLVIKSGRFGKFIACSNFPKCRYSRALKTYGQCPKCKKGQIVEKINKRGQKFYACNRWPECDYKRGLSPELDPEKPA